MSEKQNINKPQSSAFGEFVKPERVLCKRSLIIGDDYYFDEITNEKKFRDNRMLVKGDWYDVVLNENDNEKTFSIIDNQENIHLHWMYTEEDKKDWPSICKDYGHGIMLNGFIHLKNLKRNVSVN